YKSIGVDTPLGLVGGRSLFETSAELRFKATDTIGIVAFADGGTVGADVTPDFSEMRFGAGLGLRYLTGLGPIRLDAAVPLNRRPGDSSFAVYAGIGQAF
ncbi:MAG: BamA/TamA family outer membrane protein, partial [Notoacmeibacter sp.]|nr:BamA/TamA family outer membrane protein [Notoacmeibacter sp.]